MYQQKKSPAAKDKKKIPPASKVDKNEWKLIFSSLQVCNL